MIKHDDPRIRRVEELVKKLDEEVRTVDRRNPEVHAGAMRTGFYGYFVPALYSALDEDSNFVDFFPQALENMINEIGEHEAAFKMGLERNE